MLGRPSQLLAIIALALSALLLTACGSDDAPPAANASYVGKVSGTDAYIAIISDGNQLAGFLCDGKLIGVWLQDEEPSGPEAALSTRGGETLGNAALSGFGVSGRIAVNGQQRTFTADPATGEAGLYRQTAGKPGAPGFEESGWIVLRDGSFRGLKTVGSKITPAGPPRGEPGTSIGFVNLISP